MGTMISSVFEGRKLKGEQNDSDDSEGTAQKDSWAQLYGLEQLPDLECERVE